MAEMFPLTARRKTQVRVLPRFPARVEGGAGILITRAAGVYSFALVFSSLTPIVTLADDDLLVVERSDGSFAHIASADMLAGAGATSFTDLDDVPASYVGHGGKTVTVTVAEDGLEFTTPAGGGDMLAATYDPQAIAGDAFDTDNHTDGVTNAFYTLAERSKLAGIEALADVTDAANVNVAGAVMESDYNAQTVLVAVADNTPLPVIVGASTFVGRKATGDAGTMSAAEARAVLNVENGATADQTAAKILAALLTVDGVGSLLDADFLDGNSSAAFALAGHNHDATYQPLDADLTSWAGVTRAAGFDTFVTTPSSANLAALVTGETGSGALVFAESPTLVTPALGTPSALVLTNATGLPTAGLVNDAVTYAKIQNVSATDRLLGRDTAAAGDIEEISLSTGLEFSGAAAIRATTNLRTAAISFIIDGGGSAITTGIKGDLRIPFGCTITKATLLADQVGAIVIDIWKDTFANFPPADADSITASAPPTLTASDDESEDATLTGWTTAIAADDILRFNVDSVTTITRVTLILTVLKT